MSLKLSVSQSTYIVQCKKCYNFYRRNMRFSVFSSENFKEFLRKTVIYLFIFFNFCVSDHFNEQHRLILWWKFLDIFAWNRSVVKFYYYFLANLRFFFSNFNISSVLTFNSKQVWMILFQTEVIQRNFNISISMLKTTKFSFTSGIKIVLISSFSIFQFSIFVGILGRNISGLWHAPFFFVPYFSERSHSHFSIWRLFRSNPRVQGVLITTKRFILVFKGYAVIFVSQILRSKLPSGKRGIVVSTRQAQRLYKQNLLGRNSSVQSTKSWYSISVCYFTTYIPSCVLGKRTDLLIKFKKSAIK